MSPIRALLNLIRHPHLLDVNKIALSAASGHIFMLLVSPILARLYAAEDYAVYGLFMTFTGIFGLAVSLRYDLRIATSQDKDEAAHLLAITGINALIFTPFSCLLCYAMIKGNILGMGEMPYGILPLIAVQLILAPVSAGIYYALIRRLDYGAIAKSQFAQALSRPLTMLAFGFAGLGPAGLISGEIAARIGYMVQAIRRAARDLIAGLRDVTRAGLAHHYRANLHYCLYATPAAIINSAAYLIVVPLITIVYGLEMAGFYIFAERLTLAPISVLSKAVGDVTQGNIRRIIEDTARKDKALSYYFKAAAILIGLGIPGSLIAYILAEPVFVMIFGEQWRLAGQLASIFAPIYVTILTASSLSGVLNAVKRLDLHLWFSVLYLTSTLAAFGIAHYYGWPFERAMRLYVLQNVFVYIAYFLLQVYALKRYIKVGDIRKAGEGQKAD